MACFKRHIQFSCLFGAGYGAALIGLGVDWVHSLLAGGVCGISGMLPDLDSDSGRPVREVFGLIAIAAPLLLIHRMEHAGLSAETEVLIGAVVYLLVRFGVSWLFKQVTVHRGMFHSIPAAVISAQIVYLAHDCHEHYGRLVLAGGVLLGFLSHLLLDEIYSVDARGLSLHLNKAAGSALKFVSSSVPATLGTWVLLAVLSYFIGIDQGYFQPIKFTIAYPLKEMFTNQDQRAVPKTIPVVPEASEHVH